MSYNDELPVTNDDRPAGHDPAGHDRRAGHGCRAARHDGWTIDRQHDFLDDLGGHGNVTRAAGAVGMSAASAYRLRGRDTARGSGAFAAGWRAAQAMAYQRLLDLALERIENGVPVSQYYKGEFVGTKLVFSDRLLLGMLSHLKPDGARAGRAVADAADPADAYAAAMDAFAVAVETGTEPVMPAAAPAPRPVAADPVTPDDGPSPGEGPVHDARGRAACARLARGADPYPVRFPGRIYPPYPDDVWVAAYPDGLTADDLAHEDPAELALVGLAPNGDARP